MNHKTISGKTPFQKFQAPAKGLMKVPKAELDKRFDKRETKNLKNRNYEIQIDMKSMLCGLILGVVAMFTLGADSSSSNQVGRYQISSGAGFTDMLDTKTGQAWVYFAPARNRDDANFFTRNPVSEVYYCPN
jgi:hypothetical protein